MEVTIYILRCSDGSYYTGLTKQEIEARVWEQMPAPMTATPPSAFPSNSCSPKPTTASSTPSPASARSRVGRASNGNVQG